MKLNNDGIVMQGKIMVMQCKFVLHNAIATIDWKV